MSKKSKTKKRIRRGLKRAGMTLLIASAGLFGLNCGWDYIRGRRFLSFADDPWLLGADIAIALLSSIAAFMSAFRKSESKRK